MEVNPVMEKVGWEVRCLRLLRLLEESWSAAHGIRSKRAPSTPVKQQKEVLTPPTSSE